MSMIWRKDMKNAPELYVAGLISYNQKCMELVPNFLSPRAIDTPHDSIIWVKNLESESADVGSYVPALMDCCCHLQLPTTATDFVRILEDLVRMGITVESETFITSDMNVITSSPALALPEHHSKFLWLNSPIVNLHGDYNKYLESLTAKRRYKLKHARLQYPNLQSNLYLYEYEVQVDLLHEFVVSNLSKRFADSPEDYEYALKQWVWFTVAFALGYGDVQVVTDPSGRMKAITYHITKISDGIPMSYFQGIVQAEDEVLPNIGAYCLSALMENLIEKGYNWFDPTCKTSLYDSDVDTYKRLVVNTDVVKPVVYAAPSVSPSVTPPYYSGGKWLQQESVIYRGVQ